MKYKRTLLAGLLSAALYASGTYLASIYGLDPPYIYYYAGITLILISYLMMVVTIALVIIFCFLFFKNLL
jgi:hypothetical protein